MLQGLTIEEHVASGQGSGGHRHSRKFKLKFQFFPEHMYPAEAGVTFAQVAETFEQVFMPKLQVSVTVVFNAFDLGSICPCIYIRIVF